jgi:hypothetical protein
MNTLQFWHHTDTPRNLNNSHFSHFLRPFFPASKVAHYSNMIIIQLKILHLSPMTQISRNEDYIILLSYYMYCPGKYLQLLHFELRLIQFLSKMDLVWNDTFWLECCFNFYFKKKTINHKLKKKVHLNIAKFHENYTMIRYTLKQSSWVLWLYTHWLLAVARTHSLLIHTNTESLHEFKKKKE